MGKPAMSKHPPPPPENLQSPCQHAGGLSFVGSVIDGLIPNGRSVAPVILDMMGYDACPALHTLNKVAAGEVLNSSLEVYRRNLFFHKK